MKGTKVRHPGLVLILGMLVWSIGARAQTAPKIKSIDSPHQILFVGNSLTYFNGSLHTHLHGLIDAADPANKEKYYLRAATISLASLSEHTAGLPWLLASRKWDVVVLQGKSGEPIDKEHASEYRAAVLHFANLARASGARTALFMTWALEDKPQMTQPLRETITSIGNESDALVVPAGLAFERARARRPELALYIADKTHPTIAGTYLTACVFYGALFGKSPVGLSYSAGLTVDDARALQEIAWSTLRAFYGSP